jgi:type I restriction enzyme S subunit
LLRDKRQAVISHAVTKGLNPDASMKPSGVEWLGDIPAHWKIGPLKRVLDTIESGTSVNAVDEPAGEGQIGVLKTSCVYTGHFDPEENKTVVGAEVRRVSCPLRTGTLIVSRMNTPELVGAAGYVESAPPNLFLPDRLWQLSIRNAEPRFVHYWTLSQSYRGQVEAACSGTSSSMKNLAQDDFASFTFMVPPLEEQLEIVSHLARATSTTGSLLAEAERAIALLQERRVALISAAVTGRIDVRGLADADVEAA